MELLLVGGFLGSGKTTLLASLARVLTSRGLRVAAITNDQGQVLVDSALLRASGTAVSEVTGACFCCAFSDLEREVARLVDDDIADVILCEPVGSCTDIVATVVRPLEVRQHVRVLPFTVLVDPARIFEQRDASIDFLVRRQLEEADVVVMTRADTVDDDVRTRAWSELQNTLPARVLTRVDPRRDEEASALYDRISSAAVGHRYLRDLDYAAYASAEAALAWVDRRARHTFTPGDDEAATLASFLLDVARDVREARGVVGNIKAIARRGDNVVHASVSASWEPPRVTCLPADASDLTDGEVRVNGRASIGPPAFARVVDARLAALGARLIDGASFAPSAPVPTFRMLD